MGNITSELKSDLNKSLESLQTLRDEIRVRLHLAGMDAKDAWDKLEPKPSTPRSWPTTSPRPRGTRCARSWEKVKEFRSSLLLDRRVTAAERDGIATRSRWGRDAGSAPQRGQRTTRATLPTLDPPRRPRAAPRRRGSAGDRRSRAAAGRR